MSDKRILVIEDEEDIAEIITMILATKNYEVEAVLNPVEALGVAATFKPDVILLDLTMPQMSGWEVYKQFRAHETLKSTPIAIVTAKSEEFDAVVGLHVMQADAYIAKPFGKQELLDKVEELLLG